MFTERMKSEREYETENYTHIQYAFRAKWTNKPIVHWNTICADIYWFVYKFYCSSEKRRISYKILCSIFNQVMIIVLLSYLKILFKHFLFSLSIRRFIFVQYIPTGRHVEWYNLHDCTILITVITAINNYW